MERVLDDQNIHEREIEAKNVLMMCVRKYGKVPFFSIIIKTTLQE